MMQMPTSLSRIFGWEPPSDEAFIEVDVPGLPPSHTLPPFLLPSDTTPAIEPSSPASSTSALSDDQSERPQATGKKGDPNWVARPRNEFILFRCDYVRKHTKEGGNKRSRRAPGQEAEKTLSKLAAEAWRALSSEERLYWREQANLERNDHARKYPDYRYRPKKSATARKRQSRSSMSTSSVVTRSMPAPAIVDRVTVNSRSPSYEPPMPVIERPGQLYLDNNSLRKSTSVPLLPSHHGRHGDWRPLSLQPIQNSFDSRMNSTGINTYHQTLHPSTLHHSQSYDSLGLATPALSESMSIPDSTSSSLVNWNGALDHAPPLLAPQPTQFLDPISLPLTSTFSGGPGGGGDVAGSAGDFGGSAKYLGGAISGGHPSLSKDPSAAHWGAPPPSVYAPQAVQLLRTLSAGGPNDLDPQHVLLPPAHIPTGTGNNGGGGTVVFDSMGRSVVSPHRVLRSHASARQQHEDFQPLQPTVGPLTVVPGEYLASSAEMTPDEVFVMDRDEYFTSPY